MTKSRIKKSRKRAMLRGVDAMLDVVEAMLAPVSARMHDAVIMRSISHPFQDMWMPRLHKNFNPFE